MAQEKIIDSKFYPHKAQQIILNSPSRFNMVFAGRRFGKSVLAVNLCIENAILKPNSKVWYCSPTYKQTKEIAWNLFQEYCPAEMIVKKNEADLKIVLGNGSEITLKGTDNADTLVGVGINFCVLDEFPLMKSEVWYKIIRPMLIDTQGEALFIGTPRGFNWAYDFMNKVKKDNDFTVFHFKTIDNDAISDIKTEVEKAKDEALSELEKVTFRQEYEASFEIITGRPRFDLDTLNTLYLNKREPSEMDGLLNIYEKIDPQINYVIGVDTSEGLITGDNSSAVVLNSRDYTVAAYYCGKIPPDTFATYLKIWGEKFNNALIVVESNNHGLVTLNYLKDIYPSIYFRKQFDEPSNSWTKKIGFQTNAKTKPLLISVLDKALRNNFKIPCEEIINELKTYVIEEDGSTNASEGSHDDTVIATALAVQGYIELGSFTNPLPEVIPLKKRNTVWSIEHQEELVATA